MSIAEKIINGFKDAESDRSQYDVRNQSVVDYIVPDRGDFLMDVHPGGEERHDMQYDPTATVASQDLASIIISGLIKDNWFKFEFEEEINEALKIDLEKLSKASLNRFRSSKSNFNLQAHEFVTDVINFGYACMQTNVRGKNSKYQTIHPAQIWFEENEEGKPDVVYRKYKLTVRQAFQRWGNDIGQEALKKLEDKPNDRIEILHCVLPQEDFKRMGGNMKNVKHKYASITLIVTDQKVVKTSGFKKIPYKISRWNKRSGEVYGIGISGQVISYVKLLNLLVEIYAKSEEKASDPPMLTVDELPFLPLETFPGGIMPGGLNDDGTATIQPFPTQGTRGSKIDVVIGMVIRAIESAYFVEQFRQRDGVQPLTATETLDNRDKRLTLISPYSERLKTEWLQEIILLEAEEAFKKLDISPQIQEEEIYIKYMGSLSFTENSERLLSYNRFFANVASFVQLDPEALGRTIKINQGIRDIAELAGVPLPIIKSEEEEAAEAAQAQAQQQQAEQFAQLESSAKSAKDLSSAGINITE